MRLQFPDLPEAWHSHKLCICCAQRVKKRCSLSHTRWHHKRKQVTDSSVRLRVSEKVNLWKDKQRVARLVMWGKESRCKFVWMRYKSPRVILHDGHACVNVHVWDFVSLHFHTSLVCMGMWLMTFINGSEQGLGPLQCCLLSPLLSSNDFLPIAFPQGWPCHSSGLLFSLSFFLFYPVLPFLLRRSCTLAHTTSLTLTYIDVHTYTIHTHLAGIQIRHAVCVCVRMYVCVLLGKQSLAPFLLSMKHNQINL